MSGFFSHQSIGKALLWYECFSERILPSILAPLGLFFSKECCSLSFLSYMRHRHATTILTHTQYICNNCGKPHIDSTPATLEPNSCWNLILIFLVKLRGVVLRFDCCDFIQILSLMSNLNAKSAPPLKSLSKNLPTGLSLFHGIWWHISFVTFK